MKTELIQGPSILPVTADELRAQLWTIYPEKNSDTYLELLIKAATSHVEMVTWRKLISQQWRLYLQQWPAGGGLNGILLPFGSVLSVEAVRWLDDNGVNHDLVANTDYIPALAGGEPMVAPVDNWPSGALFDVDPIRIDFTAGFGAEADKVPADLRHAIQLLAAHWYEVREAVMVGTTVREVPLSFKSLVAPWKIRRP